VFYLHGFASSSQSTKAAFFGERLRARNVRVITPDFNQIDEGGLLRRAPPRTRNRTPQSGFQ
jgi:hypothetical protein